MPRKLRLEYEGAIYHVMNRGDRREDIFVDDRDRRRFLATLGEACEKTGWQVHAYCLMRNHFHLVLETPRANLTAGMQWLLGTYTARFNRRHRFFGHLFSGRYKALVVDGSGNGYLKTVCDYVHLNPVRAKLLGPDQPLQAYVWSSYRAYLQPPERRPGWVRMDRLLGEWGIQCSDARARRQFARCMEQRRKQEVAKENGDWARLRRGWCWGPEDFREELLGRIQKMKGPYHHGEELRESEEQKARRLIQRMLAEAGWQVSDLEERAKGDTTKARVAASLRAETTMTWGWIAKELSMGHWRTAANAVRWARAASKK
jgi:REP element-mobilizing transposase RayT